MIIYKIKEFQNDIKCLIIFIMKKIIVGITCDNKEKFYESERYYSDKIIEAGGIPFYLPMTVEPDAVYAVVKNIDALLVTGSRDVDPSFYGEKKTSTINPLDPNRTISELLYIKETRSAKKKILGICGGMQLINIGLGGNLFQDIKTMVPNSIQHTGGSDHFIAINSNSYLSRILKKKRLKVNSYHHQSINKLAKPLLVSARTSDLIVEGIEDKERRIIGVQWHPELSSSEANSSLFKWIVNKK